MLNQQTNLSEVAVYLICPADHPDIPDFKGIGELNADQLEDLYDTRERLNELEFELAAEAWPLYVNGNASELEKWFNQNTFWGALHLLKPALQAHIKRLETNNLGLNNIEQNLLDSYNSGLVTRPALYQAFWSTEKIYGMGDTQIDMYLARLQQKGLISL